MLIAIEGIDGAGKSSQIGYLQRLLSEHGLETYYVDKNIDRPIRNLYNGFLRDESVEMDPRLSLFLGIADPAYNLQQFHGFACDSEKVLLLHRYIYSYMAIHFALTGGSEDSFELHNFFSVPDLVFFFDTDPFVAGKRKANGISIGESGGKTGSGLASKKMESFVEFQTAVRAGYITLFGKLQLPYQTIDSNMENVDIRAQICSALEQSDLGRHDDR